jgi:3-dehydroquinate dehydratase/shikimate dehydrogenase
MTKICLCLTGKTIEQNLKILEKYRSYIDIAELRVDCLLDDEAEAIRRFPEIANIPVILTIRRKSDGGFFNRGEGSRIILMSKALAFAQADKRRNFAYIDLEEDLDVPSLEQVSRAFGIKIIRSFHNFSGTDADLTGRIKSLYRMGDEIAKAAVIPHNMEDIRRIVHASKELKNKIIIAMGDFGQHIRILAKKLDSHLIYTSATPEDGVVAAAPGQINPIELMELYRFREITANAAIYGITGSPLTTTLSPAFHNAVFARKNFNAVYLRFPTDSIESFMRFADDIDLAGASVTVPYKESVVPFLSCMSEEVKLIGACNTIVRMPQGGWSGYNTDAPGFSGSLLALTGLRDLKKMKTTIVGAGGVSRAIAAEVWRLGGKALILNRNIDRARELTQKYNFKYGVLDGGADTRIKKFSDIIIQTTSVGMEPETGSDPLPNYNFKGTEVVMDVIYKPEVTRFLSRAMEAGCVTINGYDMLIRQAKLQFKCFFGLEYPESGNK